MLEASSDKAALEASSDKAALGGTLGPHPDPLPRGNGEGALASAVRLAAQGLAAVIGERFILASSRAESYGRLFGRDSLITSLQFLSAIQLDPGLTPLLLPPVERSLQSLAILQGTVDDPWTEQEPGKILHEYKPGPEGDFHGAYYASLDSTPLFLVTLHEYARTLRELGTADPTHALTEMALADPGLSGFHDRLWQRAGSGPSLRLLEERRGTRDRALAWIFERADLDGDGLVEFRQRNIERRSLINQNWRDSRDSILTADGCPPTYPVAYAEVQAYCYRALMGEAELRREENPREAAMLEDRAGRLAEAFERLFWMPGSVCYAQGLDAGKGQLADVTSNGFHWLWLGSHDQDRARSVARRLLQPDMRTSFGLRTLSSASPNYAPLRYHRGSIWPWDNWVAATALRRLGMQEEAAALDAAVLRALATLGCPAELYVYRDGEAAPSADFMDVWGQASRACRIQAWTVGYLVEMIARAGAGGLLLAALTDPS